MGRFAIDITAGAGAIRHIDLKDLQMDHPEAKKLPAAALGGHLLFVRKKQAFDFVAPQTAR